MPFRNGFLVILRGVLQIQSLQTSTKGNRTGQGLADNVNLKLWTEKAFGSFRGYHRFSTTLNSATQLLLPSPHLKLRIVERFYITVGSLISLDNSVLERSNL